MENTNKEILDKTLNLVNNNIFIYLAIIVSAVTAGIISQSITLPRLEHSFAFVGIMAVSVIAFYILSFCTAFICRYIPKAVSIKGNIHRMEYFLILVFAHMMYKASLFLYAPEDLKLSYTPTTLMFSIGVILTLFMLYVEICATIKRLNDLKWSKWLTVLTLIPYVCIVIRIPCLFFKGKIKEVEDNNNSEENQ